MSIEVDDTNRSNQCLRHTTLPNANPMERDQQTFGILQAKHDFTHCFVNLTSRIVRLITRLLQRLDMRVEPREHRTRQQRYNSHRLQRNKGQKKVDQQGRSDSAFQVTPEEHSEHFLA